MEPGLPVDSPGQEGCSALQGPGLAECDSSHKTVWMCLAGMEVGNLKLKVIRGRSLIITRGGVANKW